jgi:magnesium-transporting ATPase (P-type)
VQCCVCGAGQVVDVVTEGRAALATSFACYKFMITYGLIETVNQLVNAYYAVTFGEWNWAFLDGVFVLSLSYAVTLALPARTLATSRPPSSPLGPETVASVVGMGVLNLLFLFGALGLLVYTQAWYKCRKFDVETVANIAESWRMVRAGYGDRPCSCARSCSCRRVCPFRAWLCARVHVSG